MSFYEDLGMSEDEMIAMALAISENDFKKIEEEKLLTIRALKIQQDEEYKESLRKDMEKEIIEEIQGEDDYEYDEEPTEGDVQALRGLD
jgi:hypothetical protein